jgi:hypothetical protein
MERNGKKWKEMERNGGSEKLQNLRSLFVFRVEAARRAGNRRNNKGFLNEKFASRKGRVLCLPSW